MSLTVSVAIHNSDEVMFTRMLESLEKNAPDMTQLIVIDNGSKPDISTRLYDKALEMFGPTVLMWHIRIRNEGFGKAHNIALTMATGDYFAVINDDVEFFENWTSPMIELLRTDSRIAQVGMKRDTCSKLTTAGDGFEGLDDNPDYIEGSCFMMRTREAVGEGLFDDWYEHCYFEDTDLSLRLKKKGFKLAQVDLDWKHHRAVTTDKVSDVDIKGYHAVNRYKFQTRWMSYLVKKKFGPFIVVRRTGSIGDVFLTLPIFRELRKKYHDCVLALATSNPEAIEFSDYFDVLADNPYAPIPCNMFIDLDNVYEYEFRKNIVDAYAEAAGVVVDDKRAKIAIPLSAYDKVSKVVAEPKYVVFEMSDTWPEKLWAYDKYDELAQRLKADGYGIILIGKKVYKPKKFIEADFDFVNQLTVLEQVALLKAAAKVLVSHEGLMIHLAQAMDLPSVGLYGCTLPQYTNDITSKTLHTVLSPAVCRGCRHRFMAGNMVICPRNAECMKMITVDSVYEAVKKALA